MWESAETIFTAFYTFEVLAKVLVLGWAKYISKPRNTFDFVITVAVPLDITCVIALQQLMIENVYRARWYNDGFSSLITNLSVYQTRV